MRESELALLARAQEGDLDAFAEFVRLFERRIRAVLARILDDERDVDEAAQDTFVQAWRNLDRFRGESAPFTWLYRIAVNEALQRTRRKRRDTRSLEDVREIDLELDRASAGSGSPEVQAANRESLAFLSSRLRALPDESRVPLVLRDLEGLSYEDVAAVLGVSVPAVKSRIHRARLQLGREFGEWLESHGEPEETR